MINAGKYNKKISVYTIISTEDDEGYKKENKEIISEPFASVKTTKGFTLIASGSDFEKALTNFTIRYSQKIENGYYESDRKMYIEYNNKTYVVEYLNNVNEANIELEMQAKAVVK